MRIMVTGHTGYIGKILVPVLKKFAEVEGFSMSFQDEGEWIKQADRAFRYPFDIVVHAATERLQRHEQNRPDAEQIFASNYHCTKLIAEQAKLDRSKLIFTSTCSSITPFSFYTWAKRCSADLIMAMLADFCVLNIFTVYGSEDPNSHKQSPIHKLMNGKLPYCFEGWTRDYIHVDDVVRAIVHVIECDIKGEYDLGTGVGISSKEMVEIWKHHRPPAVKPGDPECPEGYHEVLVARKEKMLPGFETTVDIRQWLKLQSDNLSIIKINENPQNESVLY